MAPPHPDPASPSGAAARLTRLPAPLLLSAATLFWSGNFVLGRAVRDRIPPVALAFWRWALCLALLLPFSWPSLRAQWPRLRRAWPVVVPLGILGLGSFSMLVYVGVHDTTATNASLLNSACPAFIVAIAAATGGARATPRQLAGIATSIAGVLAILTRGDPAALARLAFSRGDLWILVAVLSWAVYTVLIARRRPDGIDPLVLLTALVAVALAWVTPFYLWERAGGARVAVDAVAAASVLYVAVFASIAAYALWNAGVAAIGANRAGVFLHLMPAFGSVLAIAFLGERFRPFHAAGIALILAGVWLAGGAAPRAVAERTAGQGTGE